MRNYNRINMEAAFALGLVLIISINSAVLEDTVTSPPIQSEVPIGGDEERLLRCQDKPDGSYPDYQRACRRFFVCQKGNSHLFACLNGTVFSPRSGHCDLPSRVRCVNPDRSGLLPLAGECAHLSDGVYPDFHSGCRGFYFCSGGFKTAFNCAEKTLFDWQSRSCRPNKLVSCVQLSCEQKTDGFHVDHYSGCKRYYLCRNRVKTELVCPPWSVFSLRLKRCAAPKEVRCRGEEDTLNCNGLPDGYYPDHHTGCRIFYSCRGGKSEKYFCPGNLLFNRRQLRCDHPWKSECEPPSASTTDCSLRPDGIYAKHDSDCREFVICRSGLVHQTGACAQETAFNPVTRLCQATALVTCASVKDPDCDSRPDGMYPDAGTGCSAFYVCLSNRRVLTSYCSSRHLFDISTGTCLPAVIVSCDLNRSSDEVPTEIIYDYDCKGRVGLYPDFESDCQSFYVCAYGHKTKVACPIGTFFDLKAEQCGKRGSSCVPPIALGSFSCFPGDEGIYPDQSLQLAKWHECWNKQGKTFACNDNDCYDVRKRMCTNSETICNVTDNLNTGELLFGSGLSAVRVKGTGFDCSNKPNGVYGSLLDCRIFHICAQSQLHSSKCPAGFFFDSNLRSCVLASSGDCLTSESVILTSSNPNISETAYTDEISAEFSCKGEKDGVYPDIKSACVRYFVCNVERKTTVYCPTGQAFDMSSNACQDTNKVSCTPMLAQSVISSTSPSIDTEPASQNRVPYAIDPNKPSSNSIIQSFDCPPGQTGFYPDYDGGCKNFHICFRNIRRTYSCPSILVFNPASKSCDLPENVDCRRPVPFFSMKESIYNCSEYPREDRNFQFELLPDLASGCQRYYACSEEGEAVIYTCPPGRLFDAKTESCEESYRVLCDNSALLTATVSSALYHVHAVPKRFIFNCEERLDGFYPDYARNCHVYYRCIKSKKFSHYCKPGLLFNPKTGLCDFEENVECSPPT